MHTSRLAQLLTFLILTLLAGYLTLTQPGLCPCWLMAGADHPHPAGAASGPHGHGYLVDLFQAESPAALPPVVLPAAMLAMLLGAGGLWLPPHPRAVPSGGWNAPPQTPPPRRLPL